MRDYIHVRDLASAHVNALEYLLAGGGSDQRSLGTGVGISVLDIIAELRRAGLEPQFKFGARRDGDPAELVADASKANVVLNWEAVHSSIGNIVRDALAWREISESKAVN